jgi:hypothetical protein
MIGRIDQAVLLLQDRLEKLARRDGTAAGQIMRGQAADADPIEQLRGLRQSGRLAPDELRRALVRSLLADTLGTTLAGSLDFQALSDQVSDMLSEHEEGRALLDRALEDMGLD